jgi:hypothetical protein
MFKPRMHKFTKARSVPPLFILLGAFVALSLSSCGGNSSANSGTSTGGNSPMAYTIGGTVSNLSGTGLLLGNGGHSVTISSNGSFTFANRVPAGGSYNVLVTAQPSAPIQNCDVTNGNGTANSNVTNITVTCSSTYLVGGSVSGLVGKGLVLQNDGGDNLSISANGNYTFTTPTPIGHAFDVSVFAQPSNPAQFCSAMSASGTSNVDVLSVAIACTSAYTVGGMVSGLTGNGLVLQDNGIDKLPISSNGPFTFDMPASLGSTYNVVVSTPPNNPAQNCTITSGSGQVLGNVTNVQVICYASATLLWEWLDGTTTTDQAGIYGILGVPAATNLPGGRDSGMTWIDSKGNLWLFGGYGYDSTQEFGALNDLWEYSAGQWTWVGGSNQANQEGAYGIQGTAAPGNFPGARKGAVSWIDGSGDFWMFGGLELSYQGSEYNDLWKYAAGEWTWVSGASVPKQPGVYGTLGVASPTNVPGSRVSAVGWIDSTGALWIFGGDGFDSTDAFGALNDLWKFSSGEWTWMGGSSLVGQPGIYGTQGVAASANCPGARRLAVSWTDQSGNFWLFGGEGVDSAAGSGELNDLWSFSSGQWTWVGGSNVANQQGAYGALGTASANNFPGARDSALGRADASGNLWLFAGEGYDSSAQYGQLNDLWKYNSGQWTWEDGADVANQYPVYGTEGVGAPVNTPGAMIAVMGWIDPAGNLWIFGGTGYASAGSGDLNALWKDTP